MCAVFGLIDYKHVFNAHQRERILKVLSVECEVRGVDATGFAFNSDDKLKIFKRPLAAHEMQLKLPDDANIILGHTRMATQGDNQKNYNNHPFFGNAGIKFALAHNGIIYNENLIRHDMAIPDSHIETDSYIAVQILEKLGELSEKSLAEMAEKVSGSFVFTILDEDNNSYFVKGDNPLALYAFEAGFYIYASTDVILEKVLHTLGLNKYPHKEIFTNSGDIIKIDDKGKLTKSAFIFEYQYTYDWHDYYDRFYYHRLIQCADRCGVDWENVELLLDYGYMPVEIEDLFGIPGAVEMAVQEVLQEFGCCGEW